MIFKKSVNYSKITEYNREQQTKRENYRILNEEFALKNQTVLLGDSCPRVQEDCGLAIVLRNKIDYLVSS